MDRLKQIRKSPQVAKLIYIWECEFKQRKLRYSSNLGRFCRKFRPTNSKRFYYSDAEIIKDIKAKQLTGLLVATFSTLESERNRFDDWPIFYERQMVEPLGPLKKALDKTGTKVPKSIRPVPSHEYTGVMTTELLLVEPNET